ncbi:MAG: DUF3035 domain-containing protein [Pseudomonadota bacterium]
MMRSPQNRALAVLLAGLLASSLGGCAGVGKALGNGKNPPDEFAIATKAPLVVPPDYALQPPRPGETRPQELSASDRAQQVLIGDAEAAPPSFGEQALLQKAGALAADQNIRSILAAENGGRANKDRSLANQLMFWEFFGDEVDDSAAPLRVDDPEAWLEARQRAIKSVTGEEGQVEIKKDKALGLPGIF